MSVGAYNDNGEWQWPYSNGRTPMTFNADHTVSRHDGQTVNHSAEESRSQHQLTNRNLTASQRAWIHAGLKAEQRRNNGG